MGTPIALLFMHICHFACSVAFAEQPVSLPILDRLGVKYSIERTPSLAKGNKDNRLIHPMVGPLSKEQFETLKAAFGKQSLVFYKAGFQYNLADFLTPKIQALLNKFVRDTQENNVPWSKNPEFELDDNNVYSTTNCFTTIWELLRDPEIKNVGDKTSFDLFFASENLVQDFLFSPKHGKVISQDQLQTGNIVLFLDRRHQTFAPIVHAAYFIDGNLYFEKTKEGDNYAFRFIDFEAMKEKYLGLVEGTLEVVFIKVGTDGLLPLPRAQESLSIGVDPNVSVFAPLVPAQERPLIILASDPSMGGGFSYGLYRIISAEIDIDPLTGRGRLNPNQPIVSRFGQF